MDELSLRLMARTGDADFDPARAAQARVVLFERPERYALDAPVQRTAVSALRLEFQKGAHFRLNGLVVRRKGGEDLYRWAGSGELFRESQDLRFTTRDGVVGIECLADRGGFTLGLDPAISGKALEVLVSVSADGAATEAAQASPDRIAIALNHIQARVETLSQDTARLADAEAQLARVTERLERSQAALHEAAARHAEQIGHMRTEEGMRHAALMEVLDHKLEVLLAHERARTAQAEARGAQIEAQLAQHREVVAAQAAQVQALMSSTSWRIMGPFRRVARLLTGQRAPVAAPGVVPAPDAPTIQAPAHRRPEPRPVSFPADGAAATLTDLIAETPRTLPHTVSVVIPTYNAGPEFYWLLRKLKGQQGLDAVEVVVVDSGSGDGTDTLAEEFGCTVVRIPNSEFSHSHARNLGADNARGDLLLFTVQDAYPVGDHWLHSLALALTEPPSEEMRAAAISCSEFPRRDSELLYNAAIDTHYRFLGCREGDRIGRMVTDDHMSLRTQGQLSDVACLIPAQTFQKYRYQGRYAEDLMLGVRLLRDGLKTAMLSSVKVIHSHNRPTAYHLKRTFVDVVFLTEVFPDFGVPPASSAAGAAAGAAALAPLAEGWRPEPGSNAAEALRGILRRRPRHRDP